MCTAFCLNFPDSESCSNFLIFNELSGHVSNLDIAISHEGIDACGGSSLKISLQPTALLIWMLARLGVGQLGLYCRSTQVR